VSLARASEANPARLYNDEAPEQDVVWQIANRVCDDLSAPRSRPLVWQACHDDASMGAKRKAKQVREIEVAGHKREAVNHGMGQDIVVGCAPQADIANILCGRATGLECGRKGPRQVLVDQEATHLPRCPDLLLAQGARGIGQGGQDVFPFEPVLVRDFVDGHPGRQLTDQQIHWHTGTLDDGPTEAHSVVDRDPWRDLDHRPPPPRRLSLRYHDGE
jgi:hypothetical protein